MAAAPVVSPAVIGRGQRPKILLLAPLLLIGYYCFSTNWSVYELGRCLIGVVLLWGPLGALLYILLRRPVADPTVRLALSYAGSYSLTTLLYFAASAMGALLAGRSPVRHAACSAGSANRCVAGS